jgi:hypothetical protein
MGCVVYSEVVGLKRRHRANDRASIFVIGGICDTYGGMERE